MSTELVTQRAYRRPYSPAWWLRNGRTLAYQAREVSSIVIAVWWLWFLVEIARVKSGPQGYYPHMSTAFVVFSIVCLLFALWHSYTFLSFSGLILRIPIGVVSWLPGRLITATAFGGFFVASALIAALLVYFGR
jgi:fumarate reductase subunit C